MAALAYFPEEVKAEMELTGNMAEDSKTFNKLRKTNATLENLRSTGKRATFGLSYGAFPPKVANSLQISVPAAEAIFNNYHNVLYPGVTKFREEYVMPTALENKEIHCGLGFKIRTDNPSKDIRTLTNSTCQFWSILTAISTNELHNRIDEELASPDFIQITATIYDAIYGICLAEPEAIEWLNNNIVEIMIKDFITDQVIHNEANLEIGTSWADLHELPNNASLELIDSKLKEILND